MSYGRNPYYIYSSGDKLNLDGQWVDEEVINAFLYKVLLTNRREELKRRLQEGRQSWLKLIRFKDPVNWNDPELIDVLEDDPEVLEEKEWMKLYEDELINKLMGVEKE